MNSNNSPTVPASILRQLKVLLWTAILTLLLPSFAVATLVLSLYYGTVRFLVRIFRSELSILHSSDAMWAVESVYTDPETNTVMHFICEGNLCVEDLRILFQKRVLDLCDSATGEHAYRRLRQKWTTFLGYYFWTEDENFSLHHHVRRYDYNEDPELALPSPCTQADLVRVTGNLLSKAYEHGTSPWEMLLIPNYRLSGDGGKQGLVLCLRMHHSLADWYSIVGLVHCLFDTPMPPPMARFPTKLSLAQRAMRNLSVAVLLPYDWARMLVDSFPAEPDPWHCRRSSAPVNLTFCSEPIEWEDVRALMRKYKVNSNAAIYAVASGAAFRLLEEAGKGVPPGRISAFVSYPLPNHPGGLVNHTSGTYFAVIPKIHSGGHLVRQVGEYVGPAYVLNRFAVICHWSFRILGCVYPSWLWEMGWALGRSGAGPRFAFAATSVPGPVRQLETQGTRLVDIISSLGHPSHGATAAVATMVSIAGKVRIVFNVERTIFEGFRTPVGFAKHVEDEMRALLSLNEDEAVD